MSAQMPPLLQNAGIPFDLFISSLTEQLDKAQAAMAIKARLGKLPLTFAVKEVSLDLRAFVQILEDDIYLRPAGPGETEAPPPPPPLPPPTTPTTPATSPTAISPFTIVQASVYDGRAAGATGFGSFPGFARFPAMSSAAKSDFSSNTPTTTPCGTTFSHFRSLGIC